MVRSEYEAAAAWPASLVRSRGTRARFGRQSAPGRESRVPRSGMGGAATGRAELRAGYLAAAGLPPDSPARLDIRGTRQDVLVDPGAALVWRFPRYADDLDRLGTVAAIHTRVQELGMPSPRVIDAVLDAPLGQAHLVLTYLPGIALDDSRVAQCTAEIRTRIGAGIADLLLALGRAHPDPWPESRPQWSSLWHQQAREIARRVLPLLPAADPSDHVTPDPEHEIRFLEHTAASRVLAAAVQTAAGAPIGLVHSDLGGVNIRLDPTTGAVTGLLDWDHAFPGDPAIDTAAVTAGLDPVIRTALLTARPALRTGLRRFDAYAATWPLQEILWGLDNERPDLVTDGLHRWLARGDVDDPVGGRVPAAGS